MAVTGQRGCRIFIQLGKSLQETSPFPFSSCCTRGISGSSTGSLTVATGMVGPSMGSPVGATSSLDSSVGATSSEETLVGAVSSLGSSSVETSVGGQLGLPGNSYPSLTFQRPLLKCSPIQDVIIREGHIWLHHPSQFNHAPHQKVWLALHQLVGLLHPIL